MNTSRIAAVAAAVAIGFGVTLAGVVVSDDGDDAPAVGADVDVDDEGPDTDESVVDDERDDVSTVDDTEPEATDEVVDTAPDTTVDDATEPPPESPAPTAPSPPDTGVDPASDIDDVRCVPTISVVLDTGEQIDLVVESSEGATSWRVLDADGSFVISLEDQEVAEVVEVLRNVRFFQGAPVNFFDVCDEIGPAGDDVASTADASADDGDSVLASVEFPCSDRALASVRQALLDEEIAVLDDLGEVQLAVAIRLDELGGRDLDSWLVALEQELEGFRTFSGGCPRAVDSGFTRSGIFCAAARISADARLFEFFDTVVPAAMSDCTYEPDGDGEF